MFVLTVLSDDGIRKTLGIMLPGEYEFDTADKEIVDILAGRLDVLLPGTDQWQTFGPGMSFEVPPQSKFKLKVSETMDYCCSYLAV